MLEQCWAGEGEREEFIVLWVSVVGVMGSDVVMQVQNLSVLFIILNSAKPHAVCTNQVCFCLICHAVIQVVARIISWYWGVINPNYSFFHNIHEVGTPYLTCWQRSILQVLVSSKNENAVLLDLLVWKLCMYLAKGQETLPGKENRCLSSPHGPGDSAVAPKIGYPKRDGAHLAFEICPTSSLGLYKNSCKIFFFFFIFSPEVFLNCSCSQFIVIIPPCLFFCEFVEVGEEVVIMEKLFLWSFPSTPGIGVMYIKTVLTLRLILKRRAVRVITIIQEWSWHSLLSRASVVGKQPLPEVHALYR